MSARSRARPARKPIRRLPPSLVGALSYLGLLAGVGAVLSLGYLLFIVLSGTLEYSYATNVGTAARGTVVDRIELNVNLANTAFLWCLWIIAGTALILHHRTEASGVLVLLGGIACWLVLPAVLRTHVPEESTSRLPMLGQSLIASFQTTGGLLAIVGLLRLVVGRVVMLSAFPRGARIPATGAAAAQIAAERAAQRPSPMGRCWELQFCRGSLRSNCPRFLEGVSCWKRRSGCYCDQTLATNLLSGVGAQSRVELAEELEGAQRRSQKLSQSRRARKKEKRPRPPCGECPIYLEHQTHKYRVVSWLSYPAAAAVTGLAYVFICRGYDFICDRLGWLGVSIDRTGQGNVYYLPEWLSFQNAMVLVIGLIVVGLILQITEVLIFRFKW